MVNPGKPTFRYERKATFAEQFRWHLENGTRPDGSARSRGVRWLSADFAKGMPFGRGDGGEPERKVRYWSAKDQSARHLPDPSLLEFIASRLFGENRSYEPWRLWLLSLHSKEWESKYRKPRERSEKAAGGGVKGSAVNAVLTSSDETFPSRAWDLRYLAPASKELAWLQARQPRSGNIPDTFYLELSAEFGVKEDEIDGLRVCFRLRRASLDITAEHCQLEANTRIGVRSEHSQIKRNGGQLEIVPNEPGTLLDGNPIDDYIGVISRTEDGRLVITATLLSKGYDLNVIPATPDLDISDRKAAIIETFIQKILQDEDRNLIWGQATLLERARG